MKVVYTDRHRSHDPQTFIVRGRLVKSPEMPARAEILLSAARRAGHVAVESSVHSDRALGRIHTQCYLDFLEHGIEEWRRLPNAGDEIVPNTHPNRYASHYASHVVARAGFHMADTACPIGAGTWAAARASVDVALTVGDLMNAGERIAYGLCRPPGHHACVDMAWGFCYLNNAAVLAEALRLGGASRIAILDIDIHHGNGTQQIFYQRADVLFVSIHADPDRYQPFYCGFADEIGVGDGEGCNQNIPLAHGADDAIFAAAIKSGLDRIAAYAPDIVVLSLGLDAYQGDPLSVFKVTTEGFRRAGALIAACGRPIAIVQEGGYPCPEIGDNLVAFLDSVQA